MTTSSERYRGLLYLRSRGIPVPHWHVLCVPDDLERVEIGPTEFGWTIRTCRTDGRRETGGFYLNNAAPEQVRRTLSERLTKYTPNEFYLIYPSWKFRFSFNIVMFEDTLDVEVAFGSQKGITMGQDSPALSLRAYDLRLRRCDIFVGTFRDDVRRALLRALGYLRRLDERAYYVEIAVTGSESIVFYEMMRISRMGSGRGRR
ncbi:hypothetical protein ACSD7O_00375 [Methylorubrum extorquens]|uniref:hypothetical protein n=1 Tax=Methylorubrum extorquens TaxID=408 RepID=UPI003F6316E9